MNCIVDKCQQKAEYGINGVGLIRCKQHAIVKDTRYPFDCCEYNTCLQPAIYISKTGQQPNFCDSHKTEDDICVLMQVCIDCKQLYSGFRQDQTVCQNCQDKIQIYIQQFLVPYQSLILDQDKSYIKLSQKLDGPLVFLQFIKIDKKDKDSINTQQLTALARTVKRPVILIICNTGNYKTGSKKSQPEPFQDRLTTLKPILDAALISSEVAPGSVLIKRLYNDFYK